MHHKYLILYLVFSVFLLSVAMLPRQTLAASGDDARQFVDKLGKQVLATLNNNGESKEEKRQQLQKMFMDNMDIGWMGRFALGPDWRQATEDQKKRYLDAYRQYLLARYTTNFTDYTGSNYTITGVQAGQDGQFTVNMQIKTPKQSQVTEAGYTVQMGKDGQFKITDIIVEGVSMITTQRSDFSSVFQQKGMDGLVTEIQNKMRAEKNSS